MVIADQMMVYRDQQTTTLKWGRTTAEYNCKDRSAHFLRFEGFDADNASIGSLDDPDQGEWKTPAPNSPGTLALDFICNVSRKHGVAVADPQKDWELQP